MNPPRKPFPHLLPGFSEDCRFEHHAMNCWMEAFVTGEEPEYARQAAQEAFREIDRLESLLNRHDAGSDPARLERLQPGESLNLAIDSFTCIWLSQEVYEATGGSFDVTLGYSREQGKRPPFPFQLEVREEPGGARFFEACRKDSAKKQPVMDLGGIGKGYALDKAAEILTDWNIPAFLLHAGGSTFLAGGIRPENSWPIGLGLTADKSASPWICQLREGALSGSGFDLQPAHILDPRTGKPATQNRNAWSYTGLAALADALSTAFVIMKKEWVETFCQAMEGYGGLVASSDGGYQWFGDWPPLQEKDQAGER